MVGKEKLEIVKDRIEPSPDFGFSRGFHCGLRSQNKFELFSKYSISQEIVMVVMIKSMVFILKI